MTKALTLLEDIGLDMKSNSVYRHGPNMSIVKPGHPIVHINPFHQKRISNLNTGETHTFKDETGRRYHAKSSGSSVHVAGLDNEFHADVDHHLFHQEN